MSGGGIDTSVIVKYIKSDVAPTLGANAAFWVLSIIFIIIFILW